MIVNNKLKELAQGKQLGQALQEFKRLHKGEADATVHTYTNMINACVRCSEIELALGYLKEMRSAKIMPNTVTYTVLIKGLAQANCMQGVRDLLAEMKQAGQIPTLRTLDTVLRGCCWWGDLALAKLVFVKYMRGTGIEPSTSSYEYLTKVLCQNLRLKEAWQVAADMEGKDLARRTGVFADVAKACALKGDFEGALKAISISRVVMQQERVTPIKGQGKHLTTQHSTAPHSKDQEAVEGQYKGQELDRLKAFRTKNMGVKEKKKNVSLELFQGMRDAEVEQQCQLVETFVTRCIKQNKQVVKREFGPFISLPGLRLFPVGDGKGKNRIGSRTEETKTREGVLNFPELFQNTETAQGVRLEICSGSGDWVVDRAISEPTRAWVAIEIRFERVYEIWARKEFNSVTNLAVLGGDGREIVSEFIPGGSVADIYINFPEPPVWEQSKRRLLDVDMFRVCHKVLKPNGTLTIVTDDEGVCMSAVKDLNVIATLFQWMDGDETRGDDEVAGFTTLVPEGYGGDSYFDRLWRNGDRTKRYFLRYRKI